MRPFVEKLNLAERNSFYAKTHNTPYFEVPWHQHAEVELILFKEGYGTSFIGNYVGEFQKGDIFFLGPDLPHTFQKANKDLFVSAVVIQFQENFWGTSFISLPECKSLKELFEASLHGLKITGSTKHFLYDIISGLENLSGLSRIIRLAECLHLIEENKEYKILSSHEAKEFNAHNKERIDNIYQYTIEHYYEPITLEKVASIAAMSVPAFCNYFKKTTRKTYIEFLNDVRIDNACKLLVDTEKCITDICYNSGFNTLANFNRQFYKVKQVTPSHYRKMFRNNLVIL
jgi:AraC-like DNA-binding protein